MESSRLTYATQESNYPKSFLRRSLIFRPLPQGKRVFSVLVQFILLNISEGISEVYLQVLLTFNFKHTNGTKAIPIFISLRSLSLLLCLPMGFIADRYFGRAKVLYYSWILLFVTHCSVAFYISMIILHAPSKHTLWQYIIVFIIVQLYKSISLVGIRVNLIPFGVDQMGAASSDQLSSYFHWYYWSRTVGQFFAYSIGILLIPPIYDHFHVVIIMLLLSCITSAAGTVINMCGYAWFVKKEKVAIGNPILLIYRVLSYAASVRRPLYRSAFSYDGRPKPSRIDLAKETHFGKFRDEKVEDVKTFLRILVMLISLTGFLCVYGLLNSVYVKHSTYFKFPSIFSNDSMENCSSTQLIIHEYFGTLFLPQCVYLINVVTVLLLIPLLDRIIYPLCCLLTPGMFSRIGIGMFASFVSISCGLIVEAMRYNSLNSQASHSTLDVNKFTTEGAISVPISVGVMAPQYVFQAVAECLALITMVEFIYAQSPAYMKGLLLGCLFFTEGFSMNIGSLLILSQSKGTSVYWEFLKSIANLCDARADAGSCFASYTIIAIITLLGILLFVYSARNYKTRIRGDALRYYAK